MNTQYELRISFPTRGQMVFAVGVLVGCPHGHHFGVNKDENAVLGSELAMKCIENAMANNFDLPVDNFLEELSKSP